MADSVRNIDSLKSDQAVTVLNALRIDMLKVKAGTVFHADAFATITTPNATDLPTSITLANALKASYNAHVVSVCDATSGQGCHIVTDVANVTAVVNATDLASTQTLLNDLKAKYNLHRAVAAAHASADAVNVSAAVAATDQATSNALANDLKTQMNAHYAAALNAHATALVSP